MNKPHKHAEVLRAIADGKTVQFFLENKWYDAKFLPFTPITHDDMDWQVKPEPKPDVVKHLHFDEDSESGEFSVDSDLKNKHSHWNCHVKLTFDGETGELKSAEVLK